ncbi:ribosomal protein L1 [Gracilaria domingensis]|nr:ribosomal protein L1 [Gracilaria domingensis]
MPLAVDMRKDVVVSIQRILKSTPFSPRQGTCTSVKVGRLDFCQEQLVESVMMAVDGIARRCEDGWKSIQSLSLKTCRSLAVQIYLSLPGENVVAGKSMTDNDVQTVKKAKVDAK